MKNWMENNLGRRLISLALALCMVLSVLPPMAHADGDPADNPAAVTVDTTEGDPSGDPTSNGSAEGEPTPDGGAEGVPTPDGGAEGEPASNGGAEGCETEKTQVCTCENRCIEAEATNSCQLCTVSIENCTGAQSCEHGLTADCRLCAVRDMLAALPEAPEGADREQLSQQLSQLEQALALLTGEEAASFDLTRYQALAAYLASLPQVVTAWSWIEKDEEAPVLAEESGALVVSFATAENPLYLWSVQNVLPGKLSATVNGEAVELTLGSWSCGDYPASGAYQGTYTFTTTLPQGYVLGEDVAALEIPVIFMDGTSQWNGTESTVSYIGSEGRPETCETYTSVTDADAATWSDGWYVVSGNVTIESLTITGGASLILKNGSSLKVNSLTASGGALTVYGQEQKSGTLTIKGGMELLTAPITIISGAVCAEITLGESIQNSDNITIPAGMSVELNLYGRNISFSNNCGFVLGTESKLALWNEVYGVSFPNGIKANVPLKEIVKDGYAFFDYNSGYFITTIHSTPETRELSEKLYVFYHRHTWEYTQVENDEQHHKATCTKCLTELLQEHNTDNLTIQYVDETSHQLVCQCGKVLKTEPHELKTSYYSGTQHKVYCSFCRGYEEQIFDHVYDEATGKCTCGAVKTSYRDTNGVTRTVGCMDFREIAEECKGNYLNLPKGDPWWFVIQGTEACYGITILGVECNLILADGCDVSVTDSVNCPAMTIWGQENGTGTLTVTGGDIPAIDFGSLTINGGTVVASGARAFSGVPKMASGMMAYVVNGDTEVPVSRATAADVLNGASKVKVTACTQSHDGYAEAAYAYVDGSTHRPVCPYCGVSLGVENQPHSFGDSGSCACGAVQDENGQGVLIETLSGLYSSITLSGTYLVTGDTIFRSRATVDGSAKLILADGCTLTAIDGIRVAEGNTLTIEGQAGKTGKLVTISDIESNASIGGNVNETSGTIIIDGCTVRATAGVQTGIGVSAEGGPGSVTIRNAYVNTTELPNDTSISNSIVTNDGVTMVYGDATLRTELDVHENSSLTVPADASLTVTRNASICVYGALKGTGAIYLDCINPSFTTTSPMGEGVRIYCPLNLEDCTASGDGLTSDMRYCEVGKTITLTPNEGIQADCWEIAYWVYNYGDQKSSLYQSESTFAMPCSPVSIKPHTHTFEEGRCTVCGAVRAVYYDENGKEKTITQCTILTEEMNRLSDGWYLVTGTLNLEEGLYIVGDVKLILADGAQLIANSGIWDGYGSDSTLTIYGQENGTGILRATSGSSYGAAIGVNNVVINGGSVYAENSDKGFSSSTVQVNRGNVEVTVGNGAYAFGGSLTASQAATIRINAGANLCHSSVSGSFIFFQGSEGTVRGAVERTSVPMGADESLLVPEGSTLTLGSTTFTGPVCLKISTAPAFFASSLRQSVAATALTEANAEVYYPLVYTDTNIILSGLNETNSFTRSDVKGYLVKAGTKVTVSYNEPLGTLFNSFNVELDADSSFTMPQSSVSIEPSVQDAALAVKYGDSSYKNYVAGSVQDAFRFAMEQDNATVELFQNVSSDTTIELTGGSITLTSSGETRWPFKGNIDLKGGNLTIQNVDIEGMLSVYTGKLNVTGGYIFDLRVESKDLSDVVISGGEFGYIDVGNGRSIFFIMAEGKALKSASGMADLSSNSLTNVKVVDHIHSWTIDNNMTKPENHTQTCSSCSTKVTVPHKAAGEDGMCVCGLYVVSYVDHRGEKKGEMGCRLVGAWTEDLNNSWYVVKGTTVSEGGMVISGDVNLILSGDAVATWDKIQFSSGATLTIWSQEPGSGTLTVKGQIDKGSSPTYGTLVLNGGYVYAQNTIWDSSGMLCNVVANGGHLRVHDASGQDRSIWGTFSTAPDGCALVETEHGIGVNPDTTSLSGIISQRYNNYDDGHIYTVYGNQALSKPIEGAQSIHVPKGASLTCKEGFTTSANIANIFVDGTFSGKYENTYYGLSNPSGADITVTPEDGKKEFKEGITSKGTYYKAGAKITLGEGTWLLNNERVEGTFFNMPAQASVLERGTEINYYDENGAAKTTYGKPFPDGDKITLSDNGSSPAWFLLNDSKTLSKRLEIEGNVNLVVDAATGKLTAKQGIHVGPNATLRLYLSTATKADGYGLVKASIIKSTNDSINDAVIGGNQNEASGSIFFNGPDVTVVASALHDQGAVSGAGIGGGMKGSAGPIVVNRGSIGVTVSGNFGVYGAGIGGGSGASNTSFTINGGHVGVNMTALSSSNDGIVAAGIGGGQGTENVSNGGVLDFRGGSVNVTLNGKSTAAGIGGGAYGNAGTITISGASVESTINGMVGSIQYVTQGAAIGSGCEGKGGSVTISGGSVTALIKGGTSQGAAIGNGYYYSQPVDITITDGAVTATLDSTTKANGAAIGGGGGFAVPGKILITGGTVTAKNESPDSHTAAIGGGYGKDCSYIAITGGTVNATAPYNAIGGGRFDSGSVIGKGGTFIQLTKDVTFDNSKATSVSANGIAYIKIDDNTGYFRVYGEVTLDSSIVIPTGTNLLVPEGTELNLNGATNKGAIFVDGTLVGGGDSIYYRINFNAETIGASSDTENAVKTFQGGTYALSGKVIQLKGSYDVWYLNEQIKENELKGGTFTMPASTVTIIGHRHSISYSNQTQNGHDEGCSLNCGYKKESADHVFTDGKCLCGCLQTTYVGLDGSDVTVVGLPVPDDGIMTGDSGTGGWYILRGERKLDQVIMNVSGNVNLVLEDGATVITNRNMGITLSDSASLTIWGQTGNTGSLNIKEGIEGLGTNSLTINGGKVNVLDSALPIKFPVTVNGGELNMPKQSTAIESSLTVKGGKAIITCSSANAIKGNVTVSGGEATVTSKSGNAIEGNVTVSGGKLIAKSEASKDSTRYAIYNANMTDGKVEVKGNGQLFAQSNDEAIYSAHVLLSGGTLKATGVAYGVRATKIDADGGTLIASAEGKAAIIGDAIYVRGATVEATVENSATSTSAITADTMVVTAGNVTAKTTNTNCKGIYTSKGLTLEGGKVVAEGTSGINAYSGTVDVKGGELKAKGTEAEAILASNVNVSGGSLTAESNVACISGKVNVSGGTVKLSTPEKYGIGGQLTITGGWVEVNSVGWVKANGNGNGILITKEIKDLNSSQLSSGLIQLGTAPAKVYGAPVFNQNLTIGKTETIQNIHIPENASLTMAQGNTLTNNGHIYLDVGGSLGTAPAEASTGKVYYQVKLGEGVTMRGDDVVSVGSSSYAIGNVTFSGSNDGYLLTEGGFTDVVTDSWNVTQPITVSGHTHSWSYFGITQSKHNAICQDVTGFIHEVTDEVHSGDPCVCGAGYYGYLLADNTQAPEKKYCLPVTADTTALTTGWYVALEGKLTGKASITVSGDVNLILADKAKYIPSAITMEKGSTLTIWGQSVPSLSDSGNNKAGVFSPILVKGEGSLFINGGGVQAAKTSSTESGVAVPMTVNNGVVIAIAYATSGVFTKPITVNSGILEVYGTSVEAPIVANVTVNGGMAGIGCSGHAIQGDLIANGGFVTVSGVTGTLKNTLQNACAWVNDTTMPTIDSNWSGLLSVGEGDIVVYGTPQLREAFNSVKNIYIPAGTKLTTGGNLTTSSNLYVAGTLEGDVKGDGEIRYAITGDEATIRRDGVDLNYQDGLFAKAGWDILLGGVGIDLGIDGWMINGQFKRYYANQEATFTMPAQPTVVKRHKHDFDADGNCTCGLVQVTYWDGTEKQTVLCMPFTGETTELSRGVTDGWYAITTNFESTQTVSSIADYLTYNLVLADGCSATITGSISTPKNNLKVWGQEGGTGKLTVNSSTATPALEVTDGYNLVIEGGQLELTNNDGTALKGRVYANGGSLTATSQTGYAIDGSVSGAGCELVAESKEGTAVSKNVYISGGTATINGKMQAVGGDLIVSGGDVTVSSNSAGSATVNGLAGLNNGNVSIRNLGGGAAIGGSLNTEDAVVYLQGGIGDDSTNIFWNSLICQYPSTIYQAYGSAHLMQGASFPEEPSAIYIPSDTWLQTNGNLNVSCPIYVSGTLVGTNSGSGPIYYPLTLPEGATAQAGEGGTATFEGMLFARKGETITLEGDYDYWYVNDTKLEGENSKTFIMERTTIVKGHAHKLVYYNCDQKWHMYRCEECDYDPYNAEEHKPDKNGHCACGMILVEYKKPDGTKDSKYCFPFSHETLAESTKLSDEWYVLTENVGGYSYGYYNIAVNGNVNLILADGSYLNLYANLSMEEGSSLTIWRQEQGTGRLFIGYMPAVPGAVTPPDGTPGVGGAAGGGKLIINGGLLNVTTMGWDRACIGCDVEINGGVLSLNNMDHSCIEGDVVQKGGELKVIGNVGVKGDVWIYDGTVSFETGSYAVQGNAAIFGGTVALVREDRKSDAISGTLDTGYGSTAVIVCSGNIGTPYSGLICSGDLSNRKYEYQLYGTFFLDHELKFPAGFDPAVIYIPSGVWMSSGPEGNSYLNVSCPIYVSWSGGLVGTNSGSGKVYYQVVKENGADVAAAQGGEVTTFREGTYAYGSVTFSGGTDGYFVRDVFTDYGSLGEYQSGSGYTVTQPITVSAHTHAFDDKGNCTCTVRATVKVTMGGAESYYGSLAEALGAIGDGEATITLLGDTTGDITISQGNLTIQGDKRITAILVTGGSLEITGGDIAALEVQGGTVKLSGGTFDKLNVQGGTVKLSGGTFGTISSSGGVVELLEEDFAFRLEDGSWLDRFNGTDTNALSGGTVCPVPLKNAQLTGPSSITCGDNEELTFSVTENTRSRSAVALSWNRDGDDLSVTGSTCGLSDWDVSRGADNAVQFYRVSCTATLEGYCLTAARNITINPITLTISWSNTRFTYDGQPHNPTASSNVSGISLTLSQAQTNAGTHSAQVTGIQGTKAGNYQLPAAVTVSFTIDPAAITGVTLKADSAVYTGEAQTPAIQAVKAGELTLSSGDYDLSFSSETIQNAGTYQVTISGKGNFTGSIEKNYTITKAASSVDTAPAVSTLTYNGQAQALVSAGTANGGTLVYSLDGSSYSEKIPAITEAGTYTVWYKVQGDGNHTDTEAQKLTVSIARKDISQAAITLGAGLVYNGKEQTQTITSVTVDGLPVTYEVTGNTGTEKGTYTLTVTGTGSFTGKATAQFKIAAGAAAVVTAPTAKTLTYNGQAQALVSPGTANGGTLVYSLDGRSYSEKVPTITEAGTYTVWYKVQGDGNHSDTETMMLTVTVAPKDISKAVITLGADLTYNGKEQTQTITSVTVDGLTVTYDVTDNTATNAGSYTLTVTGKGSFTGKATADFNIAKAQPSVAPAELTITYGTKLSGCDLSGFAASFQGTKLPGSFTFDEPDVMPRVADSGSTGYQLTFTPEDLVNFHTASMEARLTVSAKELTVDAAVQDKQYDSTNKASFVSGRPALVGLVDGDVVELSHGEPYFKTVEVGTGIEIRFTDVFAISGKDSANYYLTQPAGITASIYISFKAECGKEYTVNADGWQSTDFVAAASEGYSLSGSNSTKGPWFDKLTVTQEGTGELSFYVRNNTTGAISELVKEGYRIDKSMPTGTIRFDGADETESSPRACYKKQDVDVTITGSDTLSGVASISCFLADSEKTEAELKAITQWMEKTSFTIPAVDGTSCFLYAKIVDNAGNAAYFRANRIIFDTSVPSISGVESGKVYYTTQTVTVSDANLKSVLLNGKSVESPVTLKGDVNETYELLITDQAGNEITITVTMKAISSITDPVKSITGETVTEDDRKQLEDAADTLKGLIDTATDGDEKQKLQDELDKLEELLKLLDQVKNVETMLDALPDSVTPDADKETEQDIKDARKAFDQLSEHQQSLVDERLKEKLERLEGELVDYQFESGADTVWNRSSGMNLQFVANGRLDKLDKVLVDGKELSADDFTKSSPKTTIELQAAFLGTLEQGKHTLELVYSDGKVEAGFTVMSGTDYLELTDKPVFDGLTEVEVDGISYPIQELDGKRHVMLPETGDLLTIYTYRNGTSGNTHDNYPTGMRVFRINRSLSGATITELPELADLLIYSGCSIRINGNRGVRMITSMTQSNKEALTGDGLAGFTMLESGTVVQWADSFTGSLNLDSGKHNYAYKRGTADPVFATSGGLTQYTNVLVGFDLDQCSKDIVMRPYVIVEDAEGKQYTLYGGRVTRSISYIAWQNRDTYQPGTAAYDYVHELMGNTTAG